jgi:hypothetical protein
MKRGSARDQHYHPWYAKTRASGGQVLVVVDDACTGYLPHPSLARPTFASLVTLLSHLDRHEQPVGVSLGYAVEESERRIGATIRVGERS